MSHQTQQSGRQNSRKQMLGVCSTHLPYVMISKLGHTVTSYWPEIASTR